MKDYIYIYSLVLYYIGCAIQRRKNVDIKVGGEKEGIGIKEEQILMDVKSRNEGYKLKQH